MNTKKVKEALDQAIQALEYIRGEGYDSDLSDIVYEMIMELQDIREDFI